MKRYGVGDCEMLERNHGNYVEVNDLLAWLDNLTDDDSVSVIFQKIGHLQGELGDL